MPVLPCGPMIARNRSRLGEATCRGRCRRSTTPRWSARNASSTVKRRVPADLSSLRRSKAYALSGGERRRLEITRALVIHPKFLLLDEPFAGIDPIAVGDIQHIITRLKDKQIGILITDHNVQETLSITDRAYIINEGGILEAGTPDQIVNSSTARAIYLGDRFRL